MKLLRLTLLAIAATLSVPAEACKCVSNGLDDINATQDCCASFNGNFQFGNDCQASSISNQLSNFEACCGNYGLSSDCPCSQC